MEQEIIINKYINGKLSGTALDEFEALLKKDKDLMEEVLFHKEVDKALIINEEVENNKNLKVLLNDLGKTHIQDTSEIAETSIEKKGAETITNSEILKENEWNIRRKLSFGLLAAAAAFLLFMFLPSLQQKSNVEIADNHFRLYQIDDDVMGLENSSKLYEKAKRNYAKGNLKEANQQFTAYLQEIPNAPKVLLAKGSAEFKLDNIDNALISFNQVINRDESGVYHSQANWYLALCYLKKEDKENAISHLQFIEKGQDRFKEARQLLKQL